MKIQTIFSMLLMAASVQVTKAQDVQVATLMHGDDLQVFQGGNALANAVEAAETGDAIYLSAGSFAGCTIQKAVTIQGSGFVEEGNRHATTITSDLTIRIPANEQGFLLEGIYTNSRVYVEDTLSYGKFNGNRLRWLYMTGHTVGCVISNCRICDTFDPDDHSENLYVTNCVLSHLYGNDADASMMVRNCYIASYGYSPTGTYENNIMSGFDNNSASMKNNIHKSNNYWSVGTDVNNWSISSTAFGQLFEEPISGYSDTNPYTLTDTAAATYIGADGTQVGIHGGMQPYNDVPTNPQITQFEVAPKTNANGKLEVKITVNAQ